MPAPHPAEFRQRAVALARTGDTPIAHLVRDLQIGDLDRAVSPGGVRRGRLGIGIDPAVRLGCQPQSWLNAGLDPSAMSGGSSATVA